MQKDWIRKHSAEIELGWFFLCLMGLLWVMAPLLLIGMTGLRHDNFYNYYPAFQFLADSLLNGRFPLWNPWTHAGEPFYPILVQERLLEPITFLTIWIGHYFTPDFVILCSWNRFIQSVVMVFGVYLVLRPLTTTLILRLTLIPILLFSSFFLGSFHQEGILHQFLWVPYVCIFLMRILRARDSRWQNWILLSAFIGINFQTYFFAGVFTFLLIFMVGVALFQRSYLITLIVDRALKRKLSVVFGILFLMMLPNLVLFFEAGNFVFPMRMYSKEEISLQKISGESGPMQYEGKPEDVLPAIRMPYSLIVSTGSFSTPTDFLQLLFPRGNNTIHGSSQAWGATSESYLFLGALTWIVSLIGLFFGKDAFKRVWLLLFSSFGLLCLGATGGLHRLLYPIFPPLWGMRNCHCLVLFFELSVLYFFVLGFNRIVEYWQENEKPEVNRRLKAAHFWTLTKQRAPWVALYIFVLNETLLWLRVLSLPKSQWIGPSLLILALLGYLLRFRLGRGGLFTSIVLSHCSLVWYLAPEKIWVLNYLIWSVGLPFLIFAFRELFWGSHYGVKKWSTYASLYVLVATVLDLSMGLGYAWPLYRGQPHPAKYLNVSTQRQKAEFPDFRRAHEFYPMVDIVADPPLEQIPRYLSILFRQPAALSARFIRKNKDRADFTEALTERRWNSFLELRNYFELVHSKISPQILEHMLAINMPAVQFKREASIFSREDYPLLLATLNSSNGVSMIRNGLILEGGKTLISPVERVLNREVASPFNYRLLDYEINDLTLETNSVENGFLYWADGFDSHWKSYVDGKATGVLRANLNFKAVLLPAGVHRVRFVYDPLFFKIALFFFYTTFIGCLAAALLFSYQDSDFRVRQIQFVPA